MIDVQQCIGATGRAEPDGRRWAGGTAAASGGKTPRPAGFFINELSSGLDVPLIGQTDTPLRGERVWLRGTYSSIAFGLATLSRLAVLVGTVAPGPPFFPFRTTTALSAGRPY